ncbi:Zn(II)2Cys6 transcription factor [Aspergillus stella-maris]|uniref:Zn(II)2Cys6 transcription factor n=1 Tax=Aspergillus stella-maris TaxID=1810926 RepID=UPI003CCD8A4A
MKPAPRTRASLACQSCRRRKIKCDAQTIPFGIKCNPCQQMDLPCAVDRNGDRRKAGSRRHVETLEQRVMELEGLLQRPLQNRQRNELSSWEDNDEPRSEDGVPVPVSVPVSSATSAQQNGISMTAKASGSYALQPSTAILSLAEDLLALEEDGPRARTRSCASLGEEGTGQSIGSLGPTSQYHAQSSTECQTQSHANTNTNTNAHCAACPKTDELAVLGIAVSTNTSQVKCRLLQSFYRYQSLWVNAVDEELFWDYREKPEPSMWYSGFLEAVMLASAARLSNSSAVRSLGEQYAIQAKAEIWQALENPSPASVQGFLMLSEYEISQGRERMGWQLCGMACRLLSDLGLHETLDLAETTHPIHIQTARLHLFGACISLEGIWCMYLGRPSSIPRYMLQTAVTSCAQYQGPESSTLSTWVGLCGHMADICEVLNSSRPLTADAKTTLARLAENLHTWLDTLPPEFIYDELNAADLEPAAYAIHMQYCKIQILVLQASAPTTISTSTTSTTTTTTNQIYTSALRIIRLLLIYRQIHGTERIRSVMLDTVNLALATLIEQYIQHPALLETRKRDIQWLRLAFKNMVNIQPHFPMIGRMLNSLVAASEGTRLAKVLGDAMGVEQGAVVGPTGLFSGSASGPAATTTTTTAEQFSVEELDQIGRSLMSSSWANPPIERVLDNLIVSSTSLLSIYLYSNGMAKVYHPI